MSDLVDRAQDREAEQVSDLLAEQQRRAGLRGKTIDDSAYFCARCDEPIPLSRRAAYPGVRCCIACQVREERILQRAR